jgi:hypothetical protein
MVDHKIYGWYIALMTDVAKNIIEKFGGAKCVAEICGVDVSRVYRWTYPKGQRRGTGGLIPSWHQHTLLSAAIYKGIELTPADFFENTGE